MKRLFLFFVGLFFIYLFGGIFTYGSDIQLRDGRLISGKQGLLQTVGGAIPNSDSDPKCVVFMDDDLRRTYFPRSMVVKIDEEMTALTQAPEKFELSQRISETGPIIQGVGRMIPRRGDENHGRFDEHGRRTITMRLKNRDTDIIQCITVITPQWTRIQSTNYRWDMRVATSSIPREELIPILRNQALRLSKGNLVEATQKIVRFFIQSEAFEEAAREINRVLQTENLEEAEQKQLQMTMRIVRQMSSQQLFNELELRRKNGQHALVRSAMRVFPTDGVAGETLQQVREILEEYDSEEKRIHEIILTLQEEWEKIEDVRNKETLKPLVQEITDQLNFSTLERMQAYENMEEAGGVTSEEKVALGVTCWLLGSQHATSRAVMATSAIRVRKLVEDFMRTDSELGRRALIQKFQAEEAANVTVISSILAHMKPALQVTKEQWLKRDGFFEITVPSTMEEKSVTYMVQLPLEYDPNRLYPMIVALKGLDDSLEREMAWWTGDFTAKGLRAGQAGRHGFIVITPVWSYKGQREYEFSPREHQAVLLSLRDAMQRFSVDSDRVFLAGRFHGGDAAWDVGLSHPDLWAGMILFSCQARKYCLNYPLNARLLPIYYVCGEFDNNILQENGSVLTRYMKDENDLTIVEYLGRGREDFSDEIHRIFDWMERKRRDFYPKEFEVRSIRPTDNFFWWIEGEGFPASAIVQPAQWPRRGAKAVRFQAVWDEKRNRLDVKGSTEIVRVWVGPNMLDFEQKISVLVNGRTAVGTRTDFAPDIKVLLYDYLRRGDRQNPFCQVVEFNTKTKKAQ
ncbi:MAG: hypothetical protein Q4C96_01635 [Planctomycetia bacterium]|nr:hypothetical protein [Planctomycetia bacterium]